MWKQLRLQLYENNKWDNGLHFYLVMICLHSYKHPQLLLTLNISSLFLLTWSLIITTNNCSYTKVNGPTGQHESSCSGGAVPQEHEIPYHSQPHGQHTQHLYRGKKCQCVVTSFPYLWNVDWNNHKLPINFSFTLLVSIMILPVRFTQLFFLSGSEALWCHHSRSGLWHYLWQNAIGERWH